MRKFLLFITAWIGILGLQSLLYAEGMLNVKTTPDGIEVWLDDNYVGDSPLDNKRLKSGKYSLKLVDPIHHTSSVEEIFVQDAETTTVEKTIKTKFGVLKVSSVPEGAKVYISTELGTTPVSNEFMNPGKYHLEIRDPDPAYKSETEEVTIPQGETVSLSKTLGKQNTFTRLDALRIFLGAGAIGSFAWAIVEQGDFAKYKQLAKTDPQPASDNASASNAGVQRTLGIVVGSICVVGFEVVAFF